MIFYKVQRQFIMGFDGPIDISHEAIHREMELYNISDKQSCFDKVLIMSQSFINRMREK